MFQPHRIVTAQKVTRAVIVLLVLLGVSVLLGWALSIATLKSIFPGFATMKANTAVTMLLCGMALALLSSEKPPRRIRPLATMLALLVIAVGVLTLTEYLFGWRLGIDQALFRDTAVSFATANPGRMSPSTALGFVLAGAALFAGSMRQALRWRWPMLSALGAAVGLLGAMALAAYLFDAFLQFHLWNYTGIAVHTAMGFVLLGTGLLALVRKEGGLSWSLDVSTTRGILIGVASLVIMAVVSNNFTYRLQHDDEWVSHTHEVLKNIEAMAAAMVDLESSQRGYIVTGDERILTGRAQTKSAAREHFAKIRELTADNRGQQQRLMQLDPLTAERINFGDKTIAARRERGFFAAEQMIASREDAELSDKIRALLKEMRDEEYTLLDRRRKQSNATSTATFLLLPLGLFLSLTILSLALFFLNAGIGERLQAEQALSAANENLRVSAAVIGSAMDAVVTVDESQRITLFNPAAENIFGCIAADAIGQPLDQFLPERFRATHASHIREFRETNTSRRPMGAMGAIYGLRSNGEEFPIEASISQVQVDGQRIFSVILRDISERRRAEEDLRQQASLLDLAPVLVRDMQSRIVSWSSGVEELYGYSKVEAEGHTSHELLHTEFPVPLAEIEQELDRKGSWQGELRHRARDGNQVSVASRWVLYRDAQGSPSRILEVNADITARKRAEALQSRSQKLESLGTLSGGIAHDFNNLLLAINGNTMLAIADLPHEHPVQQSLDEIAKAGARATDLVRRILAFSRPQELKQEVIDLEPVVEEALKLLRSTIPAAIEFRFECAPNLPTVAADSTQIHQIVVNLATNAAHAIGTGSGSIEFRLEAVDLSEDQAGHATELKIGKYVRLSATDNGCGMDSATLDRVFDPFFTTKAIGEGTGLGLSVVHGIMKTHGGSIRVYSEPRRGTTFHLYFPASASNVVNTPKIPQNGAWGGTERVMYVDDEEGLVKLVIRTLEPLGYQVSGYTNPHRALEVFRSKPQDFDVVVTDLSMPRMSGFDLARELLAARPDIPIVMTSGYVRPEDQERALNMGLRDLILKPDTIQQLCHILDQVFHHDRSPTEPLPG